MRRTATNMIAPALALVLSAGVALAQNSGEAESTTPKVDAAIEMYRANWAEVRAAKQATYDSWIATQMEALKTLDMSQVSAEGINKLNRAGLFNGDDARAMAAARVGELMANIDAKSVDAVEMATLDLMLRGMPTRTSTPEPELQATLVKNVLEHPKLHEAIKQGKVAGIGGLMRGLRDGADEYKDQFISLGVMLADAPPSMATEGAMYWSGISRMDGVEAEQLEAIRLGLVAMMNGAVTATDDAGEPVLGTSLDYVKNSLARMDGAAARGKLIGYAMPEMTINWSSDASITSFEDLKGQVVVVDFWATWCGPCIASFPKVQELKDHYAGMPVTIVGVTSLQGAVYGVPGEEGPVDTEGNAQKEYDLMPAVMEGHSVTWPVVFTEQDVFNPDFGVAGIPHVAIIDADGKVRFHNLHPAAPMPEKTSKIDQLLTEMGIEPPVLEQADDADKAEG